MPVEFYAELALKGAATGAVYGLMALGLSIIFGVMRVVNFAHGEFVVVAMYVALFAFLWLGLDPLVAILPVAAVMFAAGYVLERGLVDRFITRPDYQQFLLLIGIALILTNGSLMAFGPDARGIGDQVAYAFDAVEIGPILIDNVRLYAAGTAFVLVGLLYLFLNHTRTGKAIRACADNHTGAQVVGLDVRRLYAVTFGIGTACVGAAGCLLLLMFDVEPYLGPELTLLAFIIVIVGGLGSMGGALLGGILIGVAEVMAGFIFVPSMKSLFSFGLLILVLLLRPQGLFGRAST